MGGFLSCPPSGRWNNPVRGPCKLQCARTGRQARREGTAPEKPPVVCREDHVSPRSVGGMRTENVQTRWLEKTENRVFMTSPARKRGKSHQSDGQGTGAPVLCLHAAQGLVIFGDVHWQDRFQTTVTATGTGLGSATFTARYEKSGQCYLENITESRICNAQKIHHVLCTQREDKGHQCSGQGV